MRHARVVLLALAFVFVLALAACAVEAPRRKTLSERQRDSLIGESALPGATVVKGALAESDRQGTRAAEMDSLLH